MKIAVDAADEGASRPIVTGVLRAAAELDCEVMLLGPEAALRAEFERSRPPDGIRKKISFLDAPEIIAPGEDLESACRSKTRASILQACELAGRGAAEAVVSTACARVVTAACLWHIKRLRGVLRPALAARFFTRRGSSLLIDAGANTECKPWHLLQFAIMGTLYARHIHAVSEPRVGLLRSLAGDGKGTVLVQEGAALLNYSEPNFAGALEARELMDGRMDVVLCDGYLGDIVLQLTGAMVAASFEMLAYALDAGPLSRLAARLSAGARSRCQDKIAPPENEAMALLGLEKTAVICRQSSAQAVFHALRLAALLAASPLQEDIRARIEEVKSKMEFARAIE